MTPGKRPVPSVRSRPDKRPAPSSSARDQAKSTFTTILESLVVRLPGAIAAALVDSEGECVDYAGEVAAFEVRVAAAHWRIVLDQVPTRLGSARWLVVRGARRTFITYPLPEGYALVVLLRRRAGFTASPRAFLETERELAQEAGWEPSRQARHWFHVNVECDRNRRPLRLHADAAATSGSRASGSESRPLEIIGTVASGLSAREAGYRVRVDTGVELTLIREPGGRWYAEDEPTREGAEAKADVVTGPKND